MGAWAPAGRCARRKVSSNKNVGQGWQRGRALAGSALVFLLGAGRGGSGSQHGGGVEAGGDS